MATKKNLSTLSKAERRKLALRIVKARAAGTAWDGPKGICETMGVAGAPVGRMLMREVGKKTGDGIAPTYDHKKVAKKTAKKPAAKKVAKPRRAKAPVKTTQLAPKPTTAEVAAVLDAK